MRFYFLLLALSAVLLAGCVPGQDLSNNDILDPSLTTFIASNSGDGGTGGSGDGDGGEGDATDEQSDSVVPELSTIILFGSGLLSLVAYKNIEKRRALSG